MKTIGINQLHEAERGPIWIVNTSKDRFRIAADVFLTIASDTNGPPSLVTIPATWLPIELTARFTRRTLLRSSHFSSAIESGLIAVIDADTATRLLSGSAAAAEQARMKARAEALEAATRTRGLGRNVRVMNPNEDPEDSFSNTEEMKVEVEAKTAVRTVSLTEEDDESDVVDELSPTFQAMVLNLNTMSEQDAISKLRTVSEVSLTEAQFIADNAVHAKIIKMANRVIAKLSAEE